MAASSPFVHGTTYYHYANPPAELSANFKKMKEMGLNAVRVAEVWPGWEVLEPQPGRYDFDLLDDYVDKAIQAGLSVVMGIGINNPPFWMFEELPDLRTIDVSGQIASRRIHAANHDDPRFRRHMEAFIEAQASHYANTEGLLAWQFGNEIRYGVDLPDSPVTHLRFRQWLQEQFESDLDQLNALWSTSYAGWGHVFPYRSRFGPPTEGLAPLALATRRFMAWSLAELVEWGVGILRRHSALPVFHNNHSLPAQCQYSHWDVAALGDLVAQDIYPTMGSCPQDDTTVHLDVAASIARTLAKPLWISETGVGQYGTYNRNRPDRRQVQACLAEMLAAGSDAILYFRHKPPRHEQPHKFTGSQSALRPDGSELPYAAGIRKISSVSQQLADRLRPATPTQPRVAVFYPEDSLLLSRDAGYRLLQTDAITGTSQLFGRLGIPIQYFNASWLVEEDLSDYRLLYLPLCFQMDAVVADRLRAFAESGGTVICEARCAYVDANGWVYRNQPGAGLNQLFGAAEDLYWQQEQMHISAGVASRTHRLVAHRVFQSLRLNGADVLAHNDQGEVMAAANRCGRGQAILLGFAPSLTLVAQASDNPLRPERQSMLRLAGDLAGLADVQPPLAFETPGDQLSFRYLDEPDGGRLVFCANHGEPTQLRVEGLSEILACGDGMDAASAREDEVVHLQRFDWIIAACKTGHSAAG
ncbi:MAG: beta-galactosidase [Planctomycetota bacterium]